MSGIIGKLSFECDEALARPALEQMLDLSRRSHEVAKADIYQAPGIALGSTAPLYDPVGPSGVRAALDGTLANERELRAELRRLGLDVPTGGAALVGRAYEAWGERCFARFDGAFACAIWDARERRLLLARDQIGLKPLYFALLHGHGVVFASELRALFADPGVERTWCAEAIDAYLALGYVPAPLTAFERISKLEPAQFIVVDGRRLHAAQYWDPPAARPATSGDAGVREVEALIRMATRDQRIDPDCVVLYSGGDASSALLAELPQGAAPVVTVAFDQASGELARIYAAGQQLGRRPEIEEAAVETPALASQLAAHFDEPIADPSAVTQYAVCALASRYAASAIGGHGATALLVPPRRCAVWDDPIRRGIYTRTFAWQVRELDPRSRMRDISAARGAAEPLERARYVQVRSVLPESTLAIAGRAALAAGLALHLPWLDRRLVEAAAAVPAPRPQDSSLLRRMLARHLPPSLMPPASPSPPPDWLRSTLAAMVPAVLLAPRFDGRGVVSRPALRQLWEEHQGGRHDHSLRFWSLLMLELWLREHIDGDAADRPLEYAVLKAA
ncbi:MAG: asparagine synthetase B [Vicinamibacterales bacterium]